MGYQVIAQPDGAHFAIFCGNTDTFTAWDATRSEVVAYFTELGGPRAAANADRILDLVRAGKQRQAYAQFALTWEQATQLDREHDGEFTAESTD